MKTRYCLASDLDGLIATEDGSPDESSYPEFIAEVDALALRAAGPGIHPSPPGAGRPLFPSHPLSPGLRLVAVRRPGEGLVELRYAIAH